MLLSVRFSREETLKSIPDLLLLRISGLLQQLTILHFQKHKSLCVMKVSHNVPSPAGSNITHFD